MIVGAVVSSALLFSAHTISGAAESTVALTRYKTTRSQNTVGCNSRDSLIPIV